MLLGSLIRPDLVFTDLPASDRQAVLHAFAGRIAGLGLVASGDGLFQKLWEREQLGSTGHRLRHRHPALQAPGPQAGPRGRRAGRPAGGVEFGAADGRPVKVLFLVVSPSGSPAEHLQVLAAISRWVRADGHAEKILGLRDSAAVYDLLREEGG